MTRYFVDRCELKTYLRADAFRYVGDYGRMRMLDIVRYYLRHPSYRYVVMMRLVEYCYGRPWCILLQIYALVRLHLIRRRTGIQISPKAHIGKGFFIGHYGSIVINGDVSLGENVNIIQTCTIGVAYRGERGGYPTIESRVYIGAGARIFGGIKIGDNVAIGANSVVTRDVPDNAVVVGAPAKVISYKGSEGYIYNTIDEQGVLHPRFEE